MKKSEIKTIISLMEENKIENIIKEIKYNNIEDKMYLVISFLLKALQIENVNKKIVFDLYCDLLKNISLHNIEKNPKIQKLLNSDLLLELINDLLLVPFLKERFLLIYTKNRNEIEKSKLNLLDQLFTQDELLRYKEIKIIDILKEEFKYCLDNRVKRYELLDENYLYVIDLILNNYSEEEMKCYSKKIGSLIHYIVLSSNKLGLKKQHILNIYNNIKYLMKDKNRKELVKLLYRSGLKEECFDYLSNRKISIIEIFDTINFTEEDLLRVLEIYQGKQFKKNAYRLYSYFKEKNMIYELLKFDIIDLDSKEFETRKELSESLKMIKVLENF